MTARRLLEKTEMEGDTVSNEEWGERLATGARQIRALLDDLGNGLRFESEPAVSVLFENAAHALDGIADFVEQYGIR